MSFTIPQGIDPKLRTMLQSIQGELFSLKRGAGRKVGGGEVVNLISSGGGSKTVVVSGGGSSGVLPPEYYGDFTIHGDLIVDGTISSADIGSLDDLDDVGTVAYDAYKVLLADGTDYDSGYLDRLLDPTGATSLILSISGSDTLLTGNTGDIYFKAAGNDYHFQTAAGVDVFEINGASGYVKSVDTLKTGTDVAWDLGGYTAGAPAAVGYVSVMIDGIHYKLLAAVGGGVMLYEDGRTMRYEDGRPMTYEG